MREWHYPIRDGGITAIKTLIKKLRESAHLNNIVCDTYFLRQNPADMEISIDTPDIKENNSLIDWHSGIIIKTLKEYGFTGVLKTNGKKKVIVITKFDETSDEAQNYLNDILMYRE